ncbi:MAG TPA: FMN-binding negative transcriptional regulator [Noviherbaspirillum sp.]|uniref:FMN-binding negative transcriptional regulator n=1 Tax=Noviherbaspirillum sp. TaxID=1926288 RepID=UPI002F939FB4
MYLPRQFEEARSEVLHALIRDHPLGTLVTSTSSGLEANHLPFELDSATGILHAHVARANPVWHAHDAALDALVVFQGPAAYISPSMYATKQEHGKVVPTYNYIVVHVYGRLRAVDDPDRVRALLERLTDRFEASRTMQWKLADAPADYIDKLLTQIVGIELEVSRMVGKWKVSQNQPEANRASVEHGLRETGGDVQVAMADAVARGR